MFELVRIIGVRSEGDFVEIARHIRGRFARASIRREGQNAFVVLPGVHWSYGPGGEYAFFCALSRSGLFKDYAHRRYSDQEEVRS